jgi:hypothetical protein
MPETYGLPEEDKTPVERAEPIIRSAIAGHPQGAIRRIILYVLVASAVLLSASLDGLAAIIFAIVAVVALLLLALTDQLL